MNVIKAGAQLNNISAGSGLKTGNKGPATPADVFTPGQVNDPSKVDMDKLNRVSKALLSKQCCEVLWTKKTEMPITSSGVAIGDDGTVYHGGYDGRLYARDGKTGEVKWKAPITKGSTYSGPTVGKDGAVYIHNTDGRMYSIDGKTGKVKNFVPSTTRHWKIVLLPPTVSDDGMVYSNTSKTLKAYDADTLEKKWELGDMKNSTGVEAGKDGNVYLGDGENKLMALDGKTGEKIWEREFKHSPRMTPTYTDDGLYVPAFGCLHKIDPKTGDTLWTGETAGWAVMKAMVDDEGTAYIGDDGGNLRAFDGKTGRQKWKYEAASCVITKPVMDKHGLIYFTSYDGNLYAVHSKSGKKAWTLDVESKEKQPRQPAIGPDGAVYLAYDEDHLKAVMPKATKIKKIIEESEKEPNEPAGEKPGVDKQDDFIIIDGVKLDVNKAYKLLNGRFGHIAGPRF